MKKIYRIEICGCTDTCGEFWEYFPLSEYYLNKEEAEKKLKELSELTERELEMHPMLEGQGDIYGVTLNGHRPEIVEATLIENERE